MRRILAMIAIIVLLVAIRMPLMVPAPALTVNAATTPQSAVGALDNFTIYVNYLGFNDTSTRLTLQVNQGDTVTINFVWNGTVGLDTSHQLEVQGYAVISAVIDQGSPVSVIQFTASKSGTFQINCIIPCLGMEEMQNAWLVVKPIQASSTTGASTASGNSTSSVTQSSSDNALESSTVATYQSLALSLHDGGLIATVDLMNSTDNAVPGASVTFTVMTDFGLMLLGSNITNSKGVANFTTNILPGGWTGFYTYFAGSGNLNASSAGVDLNAAALDPPPNSASPFVSGQVGTMDLRLVGTQPIQAQVIDYTFLAVLTCVYLLFAIVLIKVSHIRRRI